MYIMFMLGVASRRCVPAVGRPGSADWLEPNMDNCIDDELIRLQDQVRYICNWTIRNLGLSLSLLVPNRRRH